MIDNAIEKSDVINFDQLINSSVVNLKFNNNYRSKFIDKLQINFKEEEQRWYIANLYMYMNYHPTNEFPINLENIYKLIGFANKGNAKRLLENNFVKDDDYKSTFISKEKSSKGVILPTEKNPNDITLGGRPEETIMLNTDTFKNLCMLAKTERGKNIRQYYVKLENIYNEILNEERKENELILIENQQLLENTQLALQKEKENFARYKSKRFHDTKPCDVVYAYKNSSDENTLITIGKTGNIAGRETSYNTHNTTGEMFYYKECYDKDLTEKVIHHILDKCRVHKNKEWFEITENTAKEIINLVTYFLDELIDCAELLVEYNVYDKFKDIIQKFKKEKTTLPEKEYKNRFDKEQELINKKKVHTQEQIHKTVEKETQIKRNNPIDFDTFIKNECLIGDSYECLRVDLFGAHKLWGRNDELTTEKAFQRYLEANYKSYSKYYPEYNSKLKMYKGIKPKDYTFKPIDPENPTEFEKFIIERCKVGYTCRINYDSIYKEFAYWKNVEFLDKNLKKELRSFVNTHFFPKHVYLTNAELKDTLGNNNTNSHGVWGMTLKNDNSNTGLRITDKLKKKIVHIDIETNEILNTFDSGAHAALLLKVVPSTISTDIKFERIRQGGILKFTDLNNIDNTLIPKQTVIQKNIETNEIIKKWNSIRTAFTELSCTYETLMNDIKSRKIIDNCIYEFIH